MEDKLGAMVLQVKCRGLDASFNLVFGQEVMGQEAARGRQVVGAQGLITKEGKPDLGRAPPLIQYLIDSSMNKYKTGLLREKEGSVLAARVEEVALEVEEGGRVPVEREVGDTSG